MSREEAMRRHPSYQSRINRLVSQARREQAQDAARRLSVDVEAFPGGPVPESDEVRWQRETNEVLAVVNANADRAAQEPMSWRDQVRPVAWIIAGFTAISWGPAVAHGLAGGWAW